MMVIRNSFSPVAYVALGDSTGVGVGAVHHGGYPARLLARIEKGRPGSRLVNLCVSGAATDDVLRDQVGQVAAARPALITLGIGINDLNRGYAGERFSDNYAEIAARLRKMAPGPIVVSNIPDISLAPAMPDSLRAMVRQRLRLFNDLIAEIARRHGLALVDLYTASRELIPLHPEFFSDDGFHPSDAGYDFWTDAMWPAVEQALE